MQEPNHIGNAMLEKTAGDDVTWLLHEAGLARALLIWECSLCLLLPRAGLSGHFQENEKKILLEKYCGG